MSKNIVNVPIAIKELLNNLHLNNQVFRVSDSFCLPNIPLKYYSRFQRQRLYPHGKIFNYWINHIIRIGPNEQNTVRGSLPNLQQMEIYKHPSSLHIDEKCTHALKPHHYI